MNFFAARCSYRHSTPITKASRLMKTANLGLPALQAFSNHRSPATLGRYIDPDSEAAYSLAELVSETSTREYGSKTHVVENEPFP